MTPRFASATLGHLGYQSENLASDATFCFPDSWSLKRNVASDATFRFPDPRSPKRDVAPSGSPAGGRREVEYIQMRFRPKAPQKRGVAWRREATAFWLRRSPRYGFFGRKKHSFPPGSGNPARGGEIPSVSIVAGKKWRQGATLLA